MTYSDRTLTCSECGNDYVFTAGEQQYYSDRGFRNEPKRCHACRVVRRADMARRRETRDSAPVEQDRPRRQMYPATCAECGRETEVPFEPRGIRPVYCATCFTRQRNSPPGRFRD